MLLINVINKHINNNIYNILIMRLVSDNYLIL